MSTPPPNELLDDLLTRTSRTFAATIPLLEGALREQVTIAYLLFRIADTLEDADRLPRDPRLSLLARFGALLEVEHPSTASIQKFVDACAAQPPTANADYADLLEHTPDVFVALEMCDARAASAIRTHLHRTVERMAAFVRRADERGALALTGLEDLKAYCYAVAGIVGEMLTELVVLDDAKLASAKPELDRDSVAFGEGLQLVNILKDAGADAKEGRTYVPASLDRGEVFALAAEDMRRARRYAETLHRHGAKRGTLAFHALPIRLADATLARVQRDGPGAKITRKEVATEIAAMHASLASGGSGL